MRVIFVWLALVLVLAAPTAEARDNLRIVGSSSVYPFALTVEKNLTQADFPKPNIESTTTGVAFKWFCEGVGAVYPDIAMASRLIKDAEIENCKQSGVDYTEVAIGADANVVAYLGAFGGLTLTGEHLWRAVAANVPVDGVMVPNPYRQWSDIDPSLPAKPIQIYGPPPSSGVRDGLLEQFIGPACEADATMAKMPAEQMEEQCVAFRTDGGFVEFEKAAAVTLALLENDGAVGMTSYSLVTANGGDLAMATIDGTPPTRESIALGLFKGSRTLYLYLKNPHLNLVPGIKQFAAAFIGDAAAGDSGYLVAQGLVPLPEGRRAEMQARIDGLVGLD